MATNYKNIVITPNIGSSTDDPTIQFSGGNTSVNTDITLKVYPASGGTLSFEGSAGQLFSITNDLTGSIFSVNDVSGIPSIDVNADGTVDLAPYGGNVGIGIVNPTSTLHVVGTANITSNLAMGGGINFGSATVGTVTDLTRHLSLWGGVYGLSVTGSNFNFVTPAADNLSFYNSTNLRMRANSTGLHVVNGINADSMYIRSSPVSTVNRSIAMTLIFG